MKSARIILVSVGAAVFLAALPSGEALADRASAHYHQAMALKRQGKIDKAIEEMNKALKQREDYAAVHRSIGILYRNKRNFNTAVFHL